MLSCFECDVRFGPFFFFSFFFSMWAKLSCVSVSDLLRFCIVDISVLNLFYDRWNLCFGVCFYVRLFVTVMIMHVSNNFV